MHKTTVWTWGVATWLVILGGCVTVHRIVPDDGRPLAQVRTEAGVTLTANADAWIEGPHDLPEYLTPIWIAIDNGSDRKLAVNYSDFALTDERGFRYKVVNPFTGGTVPAPGEPGGQETGGVPPRGAPVLVASLGRSAPGIVTARPRRERVARVRRRPPRRRLRRGRGRRFRVYPRWRAYFHYYMPWHGDVYWPPRYHVYVHDWPHVHYPSPPPESVRELALPEGVVDQEGSVSGFLYFHNVIGRAHRLRLTWAARTPDGVVVTDPSLAFRVETE
jgi:hypothetical protein